MAVFFWGASGFNASSEITLIGRTSRGLSPRVSCDLPGVGGSLVGVELGYAPSPAFPPETDPKTPIRPKPGGNGLFFLPGLGGHFTKLIRKEPNFE